MPVFRPTSTPSEKRARSQYFKAPLATYLRDGLSIQAWLSIGALFQSLLAFYVPPRVAILPALIYIITRFLDTLLVRHGLRKNIYMEGSLPGKTTAQYPDSTAPSQKPVIVIKLAIRSNHPLGLWHKHMLAVAMLFDRMIDDLDENSEKYDYLGANAYIANERTASNEVMVLAYFHSYEGLHKWSHEAGGVHREAWDYWNINIMGKGNAEEGRMFSIMHEIYEAPAGKWENVFINYHPSGLGATSHRVEVDGGAKWASPLVDANRGSLRTSRGRLARSAGNENEVYGSEPYVEDES